MEQKALIVACWLLPHARRKQHRCHSMFSQWTPGSRKLNNKYLSLSNFELHSFWKKKKGSTSQSFFSTNTKIEIQKGIVELLGDFKNYRKSWISQPLSTFFSKHFCPCLGSISSVWECCGIFLNAGCGFRFSCEIQIFINLVLEKKLKKINFVEKISDTFQVSKQHFLCEVASIPSCKPKVWTISPTQGCGDLAVEYQSTEFFIHFWLPSVFRNLLDKNDPAHVRERKLSCVKLWRVVLL